MSAHTDPYATRENGGPLTRARAAVDAVRTLHTLRAAGPTPDDAQRATLAAWQGWGPLAPVFAEERRGGWATVADDLAELLTPAELEAGESATYNAFYTPPAVARGMWDVLRAFGFDGGRVLEPGCGAGVFMQYAPTDLREPVRMVGVERDPTTAGIAAALHPGAEIIAAPFEESAVPEGSVNAVIGNVPFGNVPVHDVCAPAGVRGSLHDYFVWRAVRALRPGGVAVLITSRYSLDSTGGKARALIAGMAAFVGAVRLPNEVFAGEGTSPLTDVLILRKRGAGDPSGYLGWRDSQPADGFPGQSVNACFGDGRGLILGTLGADRAAQYGRTLRVDRDGGADPVAVAADMVKAGAGFADLARSEGLAYAVVDTVPSAPAVPLADSEGRKEGSFHLVDGQAWQVQHGKLTPVTRAVRGEARPVGGDTLRELSALIGLRDLALELAAAESDPATTDGALEPLRGRLRAAYEEYVPRHGFLNRCTVGTRFKAVKAGSDLAAEVEAGSVTAVAHPKTGARVVEVPTRTRPTMGGFRRDPDYVAVLALEDWDDAAGVGRPAAILSRRVNRPAVPRDRADTPGDALALCLDQVGYVDVPTVAGLLGVEPAEVPGLLGDLVYRDPASGVWVPADEYLSGDVRAKLSAARVAAGRNAELARNVTALEGVQPTDLEPGEIRARLGAPWIPADDVADFLAELLGRRPRVVHLPVTAAWEVEADVFARSMPAATAEWGTDRQHAYRLAELALNGKIPVVYDRVSTPDGDRSVRNEAATMEAEQKQAALSARFAEWVWEDPARADRLAADYNQRFNAVRLREFDGAHLTFPGLGDTFTPYAHQRSMVYRSLCTPAALCAHSVGAGKTGTMFMLATSLRRLGLARKPLLVVPNHLLEETARQGRQWFPGARILMAGKDELGDSYGRKLFAARAAFGSWDAVVITHSAFTSIPVHPHTQASYLAKRVEAFRQAIRWADKAGQGEARSVKQLAKMADTMRAKSRELLSHRVDDGLTFEQLGCDYLLIDEFHYFKNLAVPVRTDGFTLSPSKRATDLDMKLAWLRERSDRVCTGFTGTPVSNTMLELYVMQHYLNPGRLAELGMDTPDAWAANFVEMVSAVEVAPDGVSFRTKRRPAKFTNVPELRALFAEVADVQTAETLGLRRPAAALHNVMSPATAAQRAYVADLSDRADRCKGGSSKPGKDNMLKICSDGRKAALDPALVGIDEGAGMPESAGRQVADAFDRFDDTGDVVELGRELAEIDAHGKIPAVVAQVAAIYHDTRDITYPGDEGRGVTGTLQVVFCDLGTPRPGDAQVYGKIRAGLIAAGVPAGRVRFIHDADTDAAKAELFAQCRAGRVSVLMGSTDKLGVGTNVQDRVVAMHHVDAPWRPADLEQRDGRGLRPGNLNAEVAIYRYVTEGSFDSYMWQALERKRRFIDQVLTGSGTAREVEDIGDGSLDYGQIKALATGNPLLLDKAGVDATVARLRSLSTAHTRTQRRLTGEAEEAERRAASLTVEADALAAVAEAAGSWSGPALVDHLGEPVEDGGQAVHLAGMAADALHRGVTWRRCTVRGVRVTFDTYTALGGREERHPEAVLRAGGQAPVVVRLVRGWLDERHAGRIVEEVGMVIDGAAATSQARRAAAADQRERSGEARALTGARFPHADELAAATARQDQIGAALRDAARGDAQRPEEDRPGVVVVEAAPAVLCLAPLARLRLWGEAAPVARRREFAGQLALFDLVA
ncbi:hypothetical protein ABT336_11760 [Micromonospora sp. NPDC000207]|uniref:hypothetical protein n=1 Tax=Micromonospora sp. NPDC000207 TaxID=3154246 RepID=UPI00332F526A